MKDVIIIGAGVSGCAIARELSRYQLNICVLERESDICEGTSKANSGIVHGGFDAKPGTLKAKLNVLGNSMMDKMSKKLDFEFKRNGSMVVCQNEMEIPALEKLLDQGRENGVEGMEILNREQALKLEPNLADEVYAILHIPSGGIVCPFGMNIAYAENAVQNGVEFKLETEVQSIPTLVTPDFPYIHKELLKNGVTLKLLWQEYVDNCRDAGKPPYGYSQYCKLYQDYVVQNKLTMHIQPQPVHQVYD